MKRLIPILLLMMCGAASAAEPPTHAVVFMYHRFGESEYPSTSVTVEQFRAHLDYLDQAGFHVWPLDKLVTALQKGYPVPDHTVAITVDDAYESVYTQAYPLLKSHGFPFTVFVSTAAVDKKLPAFMSWEQMREMAEHGAQYANHTVSHAHLLVRKRNESDSEWQERIRDEVTRAQGRLHQELGDDVNESPRLFAYPYGEYDTALAGLVTQMGYVAFGQESGAIGLPFDPRSLPRYPINQHFADMDGFKLKANTVAMPLESVTPWDPTQESAVGQPHMRATLADDAGLRLGALACYYQGHKVSVQWVTPNKVFELHEPDTLGQGRTRYNCTAPRRADGRYAWYSHLFIR